MIKTTLDIERDEEIRDEEIRTVYFPTVPEKGQAVTLHDETYVVNRIRWTFQGEQAELVVSLTKKKPRSGRAG